jgi:hypothetical protein
MDKATKLGSVSRACTVYSRILAYKNRESREMSILIYLYTYIYINNI